MINAALNEIAEFIGRLSEVKTHLSETFQGVDAVKPKFQVNRDKRHNNRKALKRKSLRKNKGAMSFLSKVCGSQYGEKCFPGGFHLHKV